MKKNAILLLFLLILVYPAAAGTAEVVTNGDFPSSLTGWTTEYYGGASSATWYSGTAKLYAQSNAHNPYSGISQNIDLTNVNTLYFGIRKSSTYSSRYCKLYIFIDGEMVSDANTLATMTTSFAQKSIYVGGYTGVHTVKFRYWGLANTAESVYIDDVTGMATTSAVTVNSVTASPSSGSTPLESTLSASVTPGFPTTNIYAWSVSPGTGWSYKDGSAYTDTAPTVIFSTADTYTVTCVVHNSEDLYDSASTTISTSAPTYSITVNLQDAEEATFTNSTTVYLTVGDTIVSQETTTTGSHVFTGIGAGTYGVMASCDGYDNGFVYQQVSDSDVVVTLTMRASSSATGGTGVQYAPHNVQFEIFDGSTPIEGADVTASVQESSGPLAWLTAWMGISESIDLESTTLYGSTDSNGQITFQMVESLKYHISVSAAGYDEYTADIYPSNYIYRFNIGSGSAVVLTGDDNPNEIILTSVTLSSSGSNGYIDVVYNDTSAHTTNVDLTVLDADREEVINTSYFGNSDFTHTFTVQDFSGASFIVIINATHSEFGPVAREYGKTFPTLITFGIPEELLLLLSFVIIVMTGYFFSGSNLGAGGVAVMIEAWIFFFIGWLNDLGDPTLLGVMLILASALAVAYNMKEKDRRNQY